MEISSYLKGQIETRLKYDNPWWTSNSIPEDYAAMHNRPYIELFYPLVKDKSLHRSIVLMGPRRVGKTVMIFHTIERLISDGIDPKTIIYLSIDTPIYNGISLEEMFAFSREALGNSGEMTDYYVFFDEIQYLSGWEVHLKSLGDSYRNTKFVASGSAAAALREKSNESGAGRFLDFMLPPLTFSEYIELKGLGPQIVKKSINWNGRNVETYDAFQIEILNQHFIDYINFGGYPEIVFSGKMQANPGQYIRHDIVDKVLLRDLPSLYGISDTRELNRLFIYIAYRSGQEFTYENLSTDSGIGKEVLKKYLQYLEAAFLIKVINKVDSNARHQQRITAFKIYLTNPSLRCALFSPISSNDENIGSMVETAIASQWIQREGAEVYYANWQSNRERGEVDLVGLDEILLKPNWAVEIKWSDRFYENCSELKSLIFFMKRNSLQEALVTSISKFGRKQYGDLSFQFIPSSVYAYAVGRNTFDSKSQAIGL